MSHSQIYIAKARWLILGLAALAALSGIVLYAAFDVAWSAIEAARSEKSLPNYWAWGSTIVTDLLLVCTVVGVWWEPYVQLRTLFTDEGVSQPRWFGRTFIPWNSITHVTVITTNFGVKIIDLRNREDRIKINLLYYKDQAHLLSLILKRLPAFATVSY